MSLDRKTSGEQHKLSSMIVNILELLSYSSLSVSNYSLSTIFESVTSVHIYEYVSLLISFFKIQVSTAVLSLIYLDRISFKRKVIINEKNYHKMFLIALTIAFKYNEDKIYRNSLISRVGGIGLKEFNSLEARFLVLLEYSLFVGKEEFTSYLKFFRLYSTIKA